MENETTSVSIKPFLTAKEIAETMGVSRWTVARWLESGELKAIRVGAVLRIRRQDFERFLAEHSTGNGEGGAS